MDYFSSEPQQQILRRAGNRIKNSNLDFRFEFIRRTLAAALGLPYAFASHFAPQQMMQAILIYRENFQPSDQLKKPYIMLGLNVFAADTDGEAQFLASSMQQAFVNLRSGHPNAPPAADERLRKSHRPTAARDSRPGFIRLRNRLSRNRRKKFAEFHRRHAS